MSLSRLLFFSCLLLCFKGLIGQSCAETELIPAARSLIQMGDFKGVRNLLHRREDCPFDSSSIQLWLLDFEQNRNRGKERSALEAAKKASDLLPHNSAILLQLTSFAALAEGYVLRNQVEVGSEYLVRCQELLAILDWPAKWEGRLLYIEGLLLRQDRNSAESSRIVFQQALHLLASAPDDEIYIQTHIMRLLGNSARNQGDYPKSVNYHSQELALFKRFYPSDHSAIAFAHYHLGSVYYELFEYQKALDEYLNSYTIWKELPITNNRYWRYLCEAIGDMYWELTDRTNALKFYNLAAAVTPNKSQDNSDQLAAQADTLLIQGQVAEALFHYQQALDFRINNYGNQHPLTASCQNYVARAQLAAQDTLAALNNYQTAIVSLVPGFTSMDPLQNPLVENSSTDLITLLEALSGKGQLLLEMAINGQTPASLEAAAASLNLAVNYLDDLRRSPLSEAAKLLWNQRSQRLLEFALRAQLLLYEQSGDQQYLEQAFIMGEKSRAFLLLSAFKSKQAVSFADVPDSLTLKEQSLSKAILDCEQKVLAEENRCQEAREKQLDLWKEELLQLRLEYDQLLSVLEQKHPRYFDLKYAPINNNITQWQHELQTNHMAMLSFFEGDEKIYSFLLDGYSIAISEITKDSTHHADLTALITLVNRADDFLISPESSFRLFSEKAYTLYQSLVAPSTDKCAATIERLLIIPSRGLAQLPFSLLTTQNPPSIQNRNYKELSYLFQKYAISYANSATIWLELQTNAVKNSNINYSGFALNQEINTNTSLNELPSLRFAQQEVSYGQEVFGGQAYIGPQATEEIFHLRAKNLIHLATHTVVEKNDPMLTHLLLQSSSEHDGKLHAYEIYGMNLSTQLVVLSACTTAAGQWEQSEGQLSLERAFQYAGAPSLLTTLWAVDDQASSTIIQYFLKNLKQGLSKDVALQQAQLQYLKQADPATSIPYLWGAHRLMGNIQPLPTPGIFNRGKWFFLSALILALLVWRRNSTPS